DASCELADNFTCPSPGQLCNSCGNSQIEGTEKCDDGNASGSPTSAADGCAEDCRSVDATWTCVGTTCTRCGDGNVDGPHEKCDDGGNADGDGCRADCKAIEAGWICPSGM